MKETFLIIILFCFLNPVFAEEVIDLGVTGFTCKLNKAEILKDHNKNLNAPAGRVNLNFNQEIDISYKARLSRHTGGLEVNHIKLEAKGAQPKKVIYVFSASDSYSAEKAGEVNPDYGLCIEFNSLDDISAWREKAKVSWPIQIANDRIVRFLRLRSYPALVTIEGNEIEVKTGF